MTTNCQDFHCALVIGSGAASNGMPEAAQHMTLYQLQIAGIVSKPGSSFVTEVRRSPSLVPTPTFLRYLARNDVFSMKDYPESCGSADLMVLQVSGALKTVHKSFSEVRDTSDDLIRAAMEILGAVRNQRLVFVFRRLEMGIIHYIAAKEAPA
ncbi:hypothetical protein SCUP515_02338 [Seiridium cupressi]